MKINVILILAFSTFGMLCIAQEKETITSEGVENQVTISNTGMYNGTLSAEAQKFYDQGEEYGAKSDYDNAKKCYLKAIKQDSKFVEAYDNLGLVYRRLGELDKAMEYYKKSIEIFPKGFTAHQNLAVVYSLNKDYQSAIKEYKTLLEIAPEDPEGYFGLANSFMMVSKFDDALINAKKALDIYEKTNSHHIPDGNYMVGLINYYKGDKESAKKYLQIAKDKGAILHPQIEKELFSN